MSDLVNFINLDTKTGNIASLSYDLNVTIERINSDNREAPVYRNFGKSPRGNQFEIGAILEKTSKKNTQYLTLTIDTGYGRLNANLGRYPGQDDESLMAIIPWRD
jgi:uncharacterized protein (DUF736 family)